MPTHENLWNAFTIESSNEQRYIAFAEKAEAEGQKQVARLLRAAARSERIHAKAELGLLGEIRSTADNLANAIAVEVHEVEVTYPQCIEDARREGKDEAAALFGHILKVEVGHQEIFQAALDALKSGGRVPEAPVYLCTTCGNTVVGQAPDPCPICGRPRGQFVLVP